MDSWSMAYLRDNVEEIEIEIGKIIGRQWVNKWLMEK
jgi:hypothetical protein